ncbi:hypothetical protein [Corynebacterium yudongzhengii]|uniref:hypothetical protein n=1 Tax=Corynebacterium yudongzhengii TaxID=2080740 RepID=UPI001304C271|nr:hypothetical protein [Corynebacterium yudongzhengii]
MIVLLVLVAPLALALFTIWMETLESTALHRRSDHTEAKDTAHTAAKSEEPDELP